MENWKLKIENVSWRGGAFFHSPFSIFHFPSDSRSDSLGIRLVAVEVTARGMPLPHRHQGRLVAEADVDQYYAPVPDPAYGRALRGVLREFRFDSLAGRLSHVQAPTLILWGDADGILPRTSVEFFRSHLRRGTVEVLPGCGHLPQLEQRHVGRYDRASVMGEVMPFAAAKL